MRQLLRIFIAILFGSLPVFGQNAQITDLPEATVGTPYNTILPLKMSGQFQLPLHVVVAPESPPDGLTLNPDATLTGTPKSAGTKVFVVLVSDSNGASEDNRFRLQVKSKPNMKESTSELTVGCAGNSVVQPRITSHLAEGATKITGVAQPTKTDCTTRIRLWVVATEELDLLSEARNAELLAIHGDDPTVSATGTWSADLDQPLDSGQLIQVEQYFEHGQEATTIFTQATQALQLPQGSEVRKQSRKERSRPDHKEGPGDACGVTVAAPPETDTTHANNKTEKTGEGPSVANAPANSADAPNVCGKVKESRRNFLSTPQETVGVADWGRVKAYFTSGMLIAHDQGSFSNASMFLAFTLDKNWVLPDHFIHEDGPSRTPAVNTFFETRLTSVPVTACGATSSSGSGGGSGGSGTSNQTSQCQTQTNLDTFLTSRKTAKLAAGLYFPFLFTKWHYQAARNAFYLAPIAKVGFDTPVESFNANAAATQGQLQSAGSGTSATTSSTPAALVSPSRFYNNYSFGVRLGHFRLSSTRDAAPQDISHLDITFGRFSNLESLVDVGTSTLGRKRLWRTQFEGILKIPNTPATVGFSANIGQEVFGADHLAKPAPDDLRFLFGTKFDVGKLISKFKGL